MHWSFILRKLTWTGKWTSSKGLGYLGSVWLLSASPLYDTHTVHLKRCTVCTPGWIKGELGALCGLRPLVLHRKNRLMDYLPFVLICPCRFYLLLVEITTQLMFQGISWRVQIQPLPLSFKGPWQIVLAALNVQKPLYGQLATPKTGWGKNAPPKTKGSKSCDYCPVHPIVCVITWFIALDH